MYILSEVLNKLDLIITKYIIILVGKNDFVWILILCDAS